MGRRHDWTLRPELMRRKAVPVGNWPTVADIPPGALVLDSDGVVKECRWVFNNAGTDWINLGRPTTLINLLNPLNSYRVCIVAMTNDIVSGQNIIALSGTDVGTKQLRVTVFNGFFEAAIGDVGMPKLSATQKQSLFFSFTIKNDVQTANVIIDGTVIGATGTPGNTLSDTPIYIGGRTDGVISNFEGLIAYVGFYDGSGVLIDAFDPNQDALWNGGATGTTVMGSQFTVSDGPPIGCRTKALVPLALLCP